MKSILLVEDDKSLGSALSDRLIKEGLHVEWATELQKSRRLMREKNFDLVVLDIGLPDGNGFDFAKELKATSDTPFIFVTSQAAAEDRLKGYELGADEFVPKPFHLKELLLRVQHVLENHSNRQRLSVDGLTVDFHAMHIEHKDRIEKLNLRESQVLRLLMKESPRVLSRDQILDQVWGESEFPTNRTVDNVIVRLRQALGELASRRLSSVRGVGYQWVNYEQ